MSPKDTMKTISILLYLMNRLKMFPQMVDFYESFICNDDIMTKCNPFGLYYLVEIAKNHPKLKEIHRYQSNQMGVLKNRYIKMRLQLRNHFIANPCFQVFEGLSPAQAADSDWVETVGHFSEAIYDDFIFIRAV